MNTNDEPGGEDFAREDPHHPTRREERAMEFKSDDNTTVRLPRVSVDFKIPAWSLGAGTVAGIGLIVQMWFTLNVVKDSVADMNVKLTAVLASNAQLASQQELLKYRLDALEASRHQAKP